ncbi:uncharacterized protein LOC132262682 [Phlebotomus argentipes]|uniref:uncharacterized protein LOC132262682 n=1 Tax=Phlebotomus argentipes TaxID=94469 RepID=UPI002892FEA2|nr:uncharacterized protein LOC132262682 [Phlebotomus argentipes]
MVSSKWKRPESVPFPSVWRRFKAKDEETGEMVNYRVQDLPEDRYEEAVQLLVEHFLKDEPIFMITGAADEPQSVLGFSNAWRIILQDKISLVCFKEDSDEIVGVNVLKLCCKEVEDGIPEDAGKACTDMLRAMDFATQQGDLYNRYSVDKFFAGFALLVVPKFRALRLAEQILKARIALGRTIGVFLTSTVFTNKFSQAAAARAGFEETFVISYETLKESGPKIHFPGVETEFVKLMSMKLS